MTVIAVIEQSSSHRYYALGPVVSQHTNK